jgi:hypothetical protein
MMATVTEDSDPYETLNGFRRFVIEQGDSQIIMQVRQMVRESCDGEIHPVDGFSHSNQVVNNQQLIYALNQLSAAATTSPRLQSL